MYLGLNSYPQAKWPSTVAAVAVEPIYGEVLNSVRTEQEKLGVVGFGYVVSHPYWPAAVTIGAKKIVMGDCLDGSHGGSKVAKTGKTKTVGKARTNIHATLVQGSDAKWRVMQIEYLKASC